MPGEESVLKDLLAHHLVFVGGKGGVGKTTMAATLAVSAADRGQSCLLVSTDPAHSLSDIFERTIGSSPQELDQNLWGLEINPETEATQHIRTVKNQMKLLVHPSLYDEIERQLDLALYAPGATEAALLERVAELMGRDGDQYDIVIFDTAPSGHTVRLLSLPEIMGAWTDGLLRHHDRSRRLSSVLKHLGGGKKSTDALSLIDDDENDTDRGLENKLNNILQTRRRKFLVAREQLTNAEATAFTLVVNPDKLSILESTRVADLLGRFDIPVSTLIINRVLPDGSTDKFLQARHRQEQIHRKEIDRTFTNIPRVAIPLLEHDIHGLNAIRQVRKLITQPD
jgi:arsenite-transporting ATPase